MASSLSALPLSSEEYERTVMSLPSLMVVKSNISNKYLRYTPEEGVIHKGYLQFGEDDILSSFVKLGVERAKADNGLVNIRCCYNNKYWVRNSQYFIVGSADKPDEDLSSESCTLFKPIVVDAAANTIRFMHAQSGCYGCMWRADYPFKDCVLAYYKEYDHNSCDIFKIIDWESLVVLPKYITFKGDNGKYLIAGWIEGHEYLQFSSDDKGDGAVAYEATMNPNGYVRIKSRYFNKFWRRSPNWIWADTTDTTSDNSDTLFWPIKIDDKTVALQNKGNDNFCKGLTTEGKIDCLNAAVSTMSKYTYLTVEELVLERKIENVRYRFEDARIYNEKVVVVGSGSAHNDHQTEDQFEVRVIYKNENSYTWQHSNSFTLGVVMTFKAGVPIIGETEFETKFEYNHTYSWGETKTDSVEQQVSYVAKVPPMTSLKVDYLATKGTCDIPFSYTQVDKSSISGQTIREEKDDGLYTGVNYHNYYFRVHEPKTLA